MLVLVFGGLGQRFLQLILKVSCISIQFLMIRTLTLWTDTLATFRKEADEAVFFFNRSPNTTLEALQRRAPLSSGCPPGKDLGFEIYCDKTVCPAPY